MRKKQVKKDGEKDEVKTQGLEGGGEVEDDV